MCGLASVGLTGLRFCQWARRNLSVSRECFRWSLPTLKNLILCGSWVLGQKQHIGRTLSFAMLPYTYKKAGETCCMFCASCSLPCSREEAIELLLKMLCVLGCLEPARPTFSQLLKVELTGRLNGCCSWWSELGVPVGLVVPRDAHSCVRRGRFLAGGVCLSPVTIPVPPALSGGLD